MRVLIFICGLVLTSVGVHAQNDWSFQDYADIPDSAKSKAGLWIETSYNSNVLNNSVYFNYVFNTGVTRQSMKNMNSRVLNKNIAGIQEVDRLFFAWKGKALNDSTQINHVLNVGTRRLINTQFGKEAFQVIGMGNKQFAGENADLGNLDINQMQYTQIQYGWMKQVTNGISYGAGLSFLMGNKYTHFNTDNAFLYTSDIGDSLYLQASGEAILSDTSQNSNYDIAGYGAALDFYVDIPVNLIKTNDESGSIKIEVNDLGFIAWNSKTVHYTIDGDIDWSGVEAPSIFDITDSIYQEQLPSDLDEELVSESKTESITTGISPRIAIYYSERLSDKIELKNMVDYRFNAHYLPYFASTQMFSISKPDKPYQWKVNVYESLGGYGYFGFGLGAQVKHQKFSAIIGSRHILAMAVPDHLGGFNLHAGFQWYFL